MTDPEANGDDGDAPPAKPPAPFVVSAAAGAVGLVLLVAGLVLGNRPLEVAGVLFAAASLLVALYWRSMLVSAWAEQKRRRQER